VLVVLSLGACQEKQVVNVPSKSVTTAQGSPTGNYTSCAAYYGLLGKEIHETNASTPETQKIVQANNDLSMMMYFAAMALAKNIYGAVDGAQIVEKEFKESARLLKAAVFDRRDTVVLKALMDRCNREVKKLVPSQQNGNQIQK